MAVLLGATTLTAIATPTSAESVSTGYKTDGIVDLIWAAEHFGYTGPGEMQKAGVSAIRFILGITGISESECNLGLADSLDPTGLYVYESEWSAEEAEALEWVADHYCITKEQAQLYGGTIFTFFAGLDAAENGTSALRREPPVPCGTQKTGDWEAPVISNVSTLPNIPVSGELVDILWTVADESGVLAWSSGTSPQGGVCTEHTLVEVRIDLPSDGTAYILSDEFPNDCVELVSGDRYLGNYRCRGILPEGLPEGSFLNVTTQASDPQGLFAIDPRVPFEAAYSWSTLIINNVDLPTAPTDLLGSASMGDAGGYWASILRLSWGPPEWSGSSSIYLYEIKQTYYSDTKSWTVPGDILFTTATPLISCPDPFGSCQNVFQVRAINQDGRTGPWVERRWGFVPCFAPNNEPPCLEYGNL